MRSRVVEERKRERERSQCMRNDALLSFPWNRHPPPFPSRASNYEGEARGEIIRQMRSVAMTAKIRGPMKILNARKMNFRQPSRRGCPDTSATLSVSTVIALPARFSLSLMTSADLLLLQTFVAQASYSSSIRQRTG